MIFILLQKVTRFFGSISSISFHKSSSQNWVIWDRMEKISQRYEIFDWNTILFIGDFNWFGLKFLFWTIQKIRWLQNELVLVAFTNYFFSVSLPQKYQSFTWDLHSRIDNSHLCYSNYTETLIPWLIVFLRRDKFIYTKSKQTKWK